MATITFDGIDCKRVLVHNIANGNVILDTDDLADDYKILIVTGVNNIQIVIYRQNAEGTLMLVREHRVINFDPAKALANKAMVFTIFC
jgi:hypothetical protein